MRQLHEPHTRSKIVSLSVRTSAEVLVVVGCRHRHRIALPASVVDRSGVFICSVARRTHKSMRWFLPVLCRDLFDLVASRLCRHNQTDSKFVCFGARTFALRKSAMKIETTKQTADPKAHFLNPRVMNIIVIKINFY